MRRTLALLAALAGCTPDGAVVYAFPQLVLRDTGGIARVHLSLWREVEGVQSVEAPLVLDCGGSSCEGRLVDLQLQGDLAGTLWLVALGEPAPGQLAKRWRGTLPRDPAQTEVTLAPVGCTDEDRDGLCADAAADFGTGWLDCDDGVRDFAPKVLCAKPVPPAHDVADVLQDDATDSVTIDVDAVEDIVVDVPDEPSPPDAGGGLGAPCLSGADCASGHCISGSDAALVCTAVCSDGNPDACADTGWTCVAAPAGAAAGGLCLPPGACYPGAAVACCGAPDVECSAEGVATCPPTPEELCNGQDDDCDGETDEGSVTPGPGDECESEGVCAGVSPKCSKTAGGFQCDYVSDAPGYAAEESQGALCDDLDNDCDGLTDEDWPDKDGACAAGVGACQNVGLIACTGDYSATACDVTGAPPATACDDGDGATHSDHCSGGEGSTCVGTAYDCTADGLDCTDEVPQGDGTCLGVLKAGFCAIANACVAAGAPNPLNECEACDPTSSTSEWLARPNGTLCDDGNSCTSDDACGGGDCAGVGLSCDDGLDCTVDDCDGTTCIDPHPIKAGTCLVAGVCFAGGQQDPLNSCASCDPQVSQTAFTPGVNGTPCNDGKKCTLVSSCQSGICAGDALNACDDENACTDDVCDEGSATPDGCTHVGTANACDDGNDCTKEDVCTPQGTCAGTALTSLDCTDNNPCTVDFCSGTTGCDHQALDGTSCDDDGIACTEDKCAAGMCAHTKIDVSFCLIGGACVAAGTNDPANQCKACLPASSQSAYTSKADLTGCNFDSDGCTKDDVCQSGVCTKGANVTCPDPSECQVGACMSTGDNTSSCGSTAKPDGTACATDGLSCTTDACDGSGICQHTTQATTCLIQGTCYDDGAMNPDKECSACNASAPSVWSDVAKDTPCDDGNGCTKSDVCTAQGACVGTALTSLDCTDENTCTVDFCSGTTGCDHQALDGTTCDDDGISCTEDTCAAGTCTHTKVDPAYCIIGGKCIAAGSDDPANQCKACLPSSSQGAYTSKVELAGCNFDSDGCTKDDACKAGVCTKGATVTCPDSSDCQTAGCTSTGDNTSACVVSAKANGTACTADSLACTADQCTGGVCTHSLTAGCVIQGACVAEGAKNPANVCQACQSATKTDGYSNLATNTPCTADGLACTTDACDGSGVCQHTVKASFCVIGGTTCVASGALNPSNSCESCQPSVATNQYSKLGAGTACASDANPCTKDQCDGEGACAHPSEAVGAPCSDGDACTQTDQCNGSGECIGSNPLACAPKDECHSPGACSPTTGACSTSAKVDGTPCSADGLTCTTDACQAGTCAHTLQAGSCVIGGQCLAAGALDPASSCLSCQPAKSTSAYTPLSAGTICADDARSCTVDQCDAGGACTHDTLKPEACLIAGTCFRKGDEDTINGKECRACDPDVSSASWTNKGISATCTDDGNPCTDDRCDGGGSCYHSNKVDATSCNDGDACTQSDACASGTCVGSNPVKCTAKSQCHDAGACAPATGACSDPPKPATATCDDGDACTLTDKCDGTGACMGSNPKVCDDANPCTADSCDPASGCKVTNTTVPCEPADECTVSAACAGGKCLATKKLVFKVGIDIPAYQQGQTVIAARPDGGFVIAGSNAFPDSYVDQYYGYGTSSNLSGQENWFLVRFDAGGNKLWDVGYGTGSADYAYAVAEAGDGTMFVGGLQDGQACVIRASDTGAPKWRICYPGIGATKVDVVATADGTGFALAGTKDGLIQLMRGDGTGDVLWLTSPAPGLSLWLDLVAVSEGGYAVAATVAAPGQGTDMSLTRTDASGSLLWTKATGAPAPSFYARALARAADGTFLVAGSSGTYPDTNVRLAGFDAGGTLLWTKALGGAEADIANGATTSAAADHFLVTGSLDPGGGGPPDAALWAVTPSGHVLWTRTHSAPASYMSRFDAALPEPSGGFAMTGFAMNCSDVGIQGDCFHVMRTDAWGNAPCADSGPCSGLAPNACDDANPCTADLCDVAHGGCWHEALPAGAPCDDGNATTQDDLCSEGTCAGTPYVCLDDGNDCIDLVYGGDGTCTYTVAVGQGCSGDSGFSCTSEAYCHNASTDEVWVPAGEFWMGCNTDQAEPKCDTDEEPRHLVTLSAFAIDREEVTEGQFDKCETAGMCSSDAGHESDVNLPVTEVNRKDAADYCAWVGRRLCTEAEWEMAARGSCVVNEAAFSDQALKCPAAMRTYPWGFEPASCTTHAVFSGCGENIQYPGSKVKGVSPYGALDMAGNVWEWVADWYGTTYYGCGSNTTDLCTQPWLDPTGPVSGDDNHAIYRGGSYDDAATVLRASNRGHFVSARYGDTGFRCCRSVP